MRVTIPEIAWHNKDPVFSADFCYRNGVEWRMATAGADSDVKVCFIEKNCFIEVVNCFLIIKCKILIFHKKPKTLCFGISVDSEQIFYFLK